MAASHLGRMLAQEVDKEVQELMLGLANGVKDWADYQFRIGILEGLKRAVQIVERLEGED